MSGQTDRSPQPFVVMAKPVGSSCNMRCRYCYYLDKGKFSTHEKQTRINMTLLEKMISQAIEGNPGPVISFIWHGGEPTLAGLDFYRQVVSIERKYMTPGKEIWNNLQTNGLLLDERWCEFLAANNFDVGVSIDGTEAVHDTNRRDLGGNGTYARVAHAVDLLKCAGIEPDLLCTVNSASLTDPLGVYRALRDLDTGWIQFIPIVVRERADTGLFSGENSTGSASSAENEEILISAESVTPEGYGKFLCDVFDEWAYNDLGKVDVQIFAEVSRVLAGGSASLCTMAETCGRVLIAEEDGSIYSCDHFVDPDHRIGNLKRDRLGDVVDSEFQTGFGNAKRDGMTAQCRRCQWLDLCNGGCPKDRFGISADGEYGQYFLCRGLEMFFEHAVPVIRSMIDLSRKGKDAKKIMRKLRSEREDLI